MSTLTPNIPELSALDGTCWRIDPDRSRVAFETPTLWGLTTVKGRFARYDGTLDLGRQPAIELTIDADSLDTGNKMRDRHLRSADFFDVEDHPHVKFVSDSALLDGERLRIRGDLAAGQSSIPLEFVATIRAIGDELEVDTVTEVDHRRLGMTHSTLGMIRGLTTLSVSGRLVRDAG